MLIRTGTHHAETKNEVVFVRGVVATVTNRRDASVEVPRATAEDAGTARRSAGWVSRLFCTYTTIPVITPFPYIAAHVI